LIHRGRGFVADVFCVNEGIEKHTATGLASIAMLSEDAKIKSPAA
jgi:hypothetical protein